MKTKTTLLSLLMVGFAHSATIISTLTSPKITSNVIFDNGLYNYQYVVSSSPVDCGYDLSNIILNLCNSDLTFKYYGDDPYNLSKTKTTLKFNDINANGNTFVFGYSSNNPPTTTTAIIKNYNDTFTNKILTPNCIPETSTLMLSLLTIPLFFKRRNR